METIFHILTGDERVLVEVTNTWCELLVAQVLYRDPFINPADIGYVCIYVAPE